jgi:hypothetical protein
MGEQIRVERIRKMLLHFRSTTAQTWWEYRATVIEDALWLVAELDRMSDAHKSEQSAANSSDAHNSEPEDRPIGEWSADPQCSVCFDSFVTREGREIHENLEHEVFATSANRPVIAYSDANGTSTDQLVRPQAATSDAIGSRGDITTTGDDR